MWQACLYWRVPSFRKPESRCLTECMQPACPRCARCSARAGGVVVWCGDAMLGNAHTTPVLPPPVHGADRVLLHVLLSRAVLPNLQAHGAGRGCGSAGATRILLPRPHYLHTVRQVVWCARFRCRACMTGRVSMPCARVCNSGTPWDNSHAYVVEHHHLITSRWPGDAFLFARRFIARLEEVPRLY